MLDSHVDDFLAGRVEKLYELQEIAAVLCLHPVHLSKVIKLATGQHACHFYEQRLVQEAKKQLTSTALPIGEIARQLYYDVSDFTKFFKRFTGLIPSAYRKATGQPPFLAPEKAICIKRIITIGADTTSPLLARTPGYGTLRLTGEDL